MQLVDTKPIVQDKVDDIQRPENHVKYGNIRIKKEYLKLMDSPKFAYHLAEKNNLTYASIRNWLKENQFYLTTYYNLKVTCDYFKITDINVLIEEF
jgi:hypothetical protein